MSAPELDKTIESTVVCVSAHNARDHEFSDSSVDKIVLVLRPELATGTLLNIAACLTAGITATQPQHAGQPLQDLAGLNSAASSHLPVVVLKGNDQVFERILQQLKQQQDAGRVCIFPDYAQAIHQAEQYWQIHQQTVHNGGHISGLALSGTKKWLNRLTGNLALLR